ncbi:unnamed protein product, partial [Amoebophrya sp. A25]|eukprot:GSA25T00015988001.1
MSPRARGGLHDDGSGDDVAGSLLSEGDVSSGSCSGTTTKCRRGSSAREQDSDRGSGPSEFFMSGMPSAGDIGGTSCVSRSLVPPPPGCSGVTSCG